MADNQQNWIGHLSLAKTIKADISALLMHVDKELERIAGSLGPGGAPQKRMDQLGQNVVGGAPKAKATQDILILLGQLRRELQRSIGGTAVTRTGMTNGQGILDQIVKRIEQAIAEITAI